MRAQPQSSGRGRAILETPPHSLLPALDQHLLETGRGRVRRLVVRQSSYSTSAVIANLFVTLDDGQTLRLVHKRMEADVVGPAARDVKPSFVRNPGREIWVYRDLLRRLPGLDTPELHGSGTGADGHWLLLERVEGIELWRVGDRRAWSEAARWLGRMHTAAAPYIDLMASANAVPWYDAGFQMRWADRARRRLQRDRQSEASSLLRGLWPRYQSVAEELAQLPRTVLHGDFNASNVMVTRTPDGPRIRPVDWELAGVGPGLLDLAALVSGGWTEGERGAFVAAYRGAQGPGPLASFSDRDFARGLEVCRLALAVQWLGWSNRWTPPPEHAHAWDLEAATLAARLGFLD